MTIWILAVLLLASLAGLGYRQGAIRVGFSFFGIIVGALLAVPLGHLLAKGLTFFSLKDPLLLWALGPVLVFVIVSIIFKVAAAAVHQKVEVHYKYKAGDLRLALWERLNHRVGLSLGLLNGAAYLVLLCFLIYVPSYLTFQVASDGSDPFWMRTLNHMGADLQSTGMAKVARSVDSIPQVDYDMADFLGLLYRNPLAEARVSSYPAFLAIAEQPAFQSLGNDSTFISAWQRQEPALTLLAQPSLQAIRGNPELLKSVWQAAAENMSDFRTYLATGKSAKYDPIQILGRWNFDVNAAVLAVRRAKPNITSKEMFRIRQYMEAAFSKTSLVAMPDKQVIVKDVPPLGAHAPVAPGAGPQLQTLQGQWQDLDGGKYQISLNGMEMPANVQGDRLTIKADTTELVFNPAD